MFAGPPHKSVWVRIVAPLAIALLSSLVRAERLPLKTYTVADGLAHNEINKIVRDSRGRSVDGPCQALHYRGWFSARLVSRRLS